MGATKDLAIIPATPPQRRLRTSLGRVWIVEKRGGVSAMICALSE
jgi:hypothetical protein